MVNRKKIVLLTASHLSSCPRLLKEASLLDREEFEIHILFLNSVPSIEILDQSIVDNNTTWNFHPIYWYGEKANIFQNLISKLKAKFYKVFNITSDYIQSTSDVLIKETLKIKADLYIAHHPSVLVAAAKAAHQFNAKYCYDVEDAFSFMETSEITKPDRFVFNVESKYIHQASLLTFASPLYRDLYYQTFHINNRMFDLFNVFSINNSEIVEYKDRKDLSKISFYWHSQTVGLNRGIQDIIHCLSKFDAHKWELHIRGHYTQEIISELLKSSTNEESLSSIFFHEPLPANELPVRTKEHDIGLAMELKNTINRDLCVSNKILEYIASGLMVISTDTKGHQYVMNKLGAKDFTYANTIELCKILEHLFTDTKSIHKLKVHNQEIASAELSWELQSIKWLDEIKATLE